MRVRFDRDGTAQCPKRGFITFDTCLKCPDHICQEEFVVMCKDCTFDPDKWEQLSRREKADEMRRWLTCECSVCTSLRSVLGEDALQRAIGGETNAAD